MKRLLAAGSAGALLFALTYAGLFAQQPQRQLTPEQQALQEAARQDHKRMLEALKITSLRPGASPNLQAPNAANYDESKANPYPKLPDPLVLKNGKKVTSARMWLKQRRPEIVEDFDREVYGRAPKNVPKAHWEVITTTQETKFDIPVVTKQLIGRVDNSAYPQITVNIQLTLTTPANAKAGVPVMMQFGCGKPCWHRQLPLDGREFHQVCRAVDLERSACGRARTDCAARAAPDLYQLRRGGRAWS